MSSWLLIIALLGFRMVDAAQRSKKITLFSDLLIPPPPGPGQFPAASVPAPSAIPAIALAPAPRPAPAQAPSLRAAPYPAPAPALAPASLSIEAAQPPNLDFGSLHFFARIRGTFVPKEVDPGLSKDARDLANDPKDFAFLEPMEIMGSVVLWLFLYVTMAVYYHKYVLTEPDPEASKEEMEKREHFADFQDWKSGLFACKEDLPICFWSCCCPGIRWADTMSEIGLHKYWTAFGIFTGLYIISIVPYATWLCWAIVAGYCTYHRQEFRKKFNFEETGTESAFADFAAYCCCMWCAVAQEARMVKEACRVNHPAIEREEWKTSARSSAPPPSPASTV